MRQILITGSSGLVGSALVKSLREAGDNVRRLVRSQDSLQEDAVFWRPATGEVDAASLEGLDAVIHLAGENLAAGRWNAARKDRIRRSRVEGTRLLSESLAGREKPPQVLICASAVGFYGDRGDEILEEGSAVGEGFLADVCAEWEAAADPARNRGIRVVHQRLGVVLSDLGGALAKMLGLFRLGLGGKLGSGEQYLSWITLDDVVGAFSHCLHHEELLGPVNTVSPTPVTNATFTAALARVLGRPAVLPAPAFALRMALGEMADEALLASARVRPAKLLESGYNFRHREIEPALRAVLSRTA
jgi:uncharacterized protein (TIGR01777 family)